MNNEVKQKLTEALRSGKYQQTRMRLRDEDGFCCLGVLCDLASKEGLGSWGDCDVFTDREGDASVGRLTKAVRDWSGLSSTGDYGEIPSERCLMADNDVKRKSFNEIADIIDANF